MPLRFSPPPRRRPPRARGSGAEGLTGAAPRRPVRPRPPPPRVSPPPARPRPAGHDFRQRGELLPCFHFAFDVPQNTEAVFWCQPAPRLLYLGRAPVAGPWESRLTPRILKFSPPPGRQSVYSRTSRPPGRWRPNTGRRSRGPGSAAPTDGLRVLQRRGNSGRRDSSRDCPPSLCLDAAVGAAKVKKRNAAAPPPAAL